MRKLVCLSILVINLFFLYLGFMLSKLVNTCYIRSATPSVLDISLNNGSPFVIRVPINASGIFIMAFLWKDLL